MAQKSGWLIAVWVFGVAVGVVIGRFVAAPGPDPAKAVTSDPVAQAEPAGAGGSDGTGSSDASGGASSDDTVAADANAGAGTGADTDTEAKQSAVAEQQARVEAANALLKRLTRDLPQGPVELTGHYFNERLRFRATRDTAGGLTLLLTDARTGGPVIAVRDGKALVWDLLNENIVLLDHAATTVYLGSRQGGVDLELGYRPLPGAGEGSGNGRGGDGGEVSAADLFRFDAPAVLSRINGGINVATYRDGSLGLTGQAKLPGDDNVVLRAVLSPDRAYPLTALRMFRDNRQALAVEQVNLGPEADTAPNFTIPDSDAVAARYKLFELDLTGISATQSSAVSRRGLTTTFLLAGLAEGPSQPSDRRRAEQFAGFTHDWPALHAKQDRSVPVLRELLGMPRNP